MKIELQQSANFKAWGALATRVGRGAWTGLVPDVCTAPKEGTDLRFIKDGFSGPPAAQVFRVRVTVTP